MVDGFGNVFAKNVSTRWGRALGGILRYFEDNNLAEAKRTEQVLTTTNWRTGLHITLELEVNKQSSLSEPAHSLSPLLRIRRSSLICSP